MKTKGTITLEFPDMNPAERLQELIIYIAERMAGDETFGRVKLAKLLYFADFSSFRMYKRPITGSAYVHWNQGPVPQGFLDILEEMETNGHIITRSEAYFQYEQKRPVARRKADLTRFSGRDIQLVEELIRRYWGKTATEVGDLSHGVAWKLVAQNEKIPYEMSFLSDEPLTETELERVIQAGKEYGLG
jgi:uncharacterized phage-associated protein